jgi:CelD/BcsL family acetyltransferase involved in cellulose biosynthesis
MIRSLDLSAMRNSAWEAMPASASRPARILVSSQLSDFAQTWPRSDRQGPARCYAFQCSDVLQLLCDTLIAARGAEPFFIAILAENETPLALIPLSIERQNQTRILRFLDGGFSDYNAPVLYPAARDWDKQVVSVIWQAVQQLLPRFDIALLEKMPDRILDFPNPFMSLQTARHPVSGHAISLAGTIEELRRKVPHRENSRYQLRRLNKLGTLSFQVADTPERYDAFLEALMRQKSDRYLQTRGVDGLDRPGYRACLHDAKRLLPPAGPVRLFALTLDDKILATSWGYVVDSRFYYLMLSFEGGAWRTYSLGRLMLNSLCEWCLSQGLSALDCGVGDEEFKLEYCDVLTSLYDAEIPTSINGQLYLLMRSTKKTLVETKLWALVRPLVKGIRYTKH